MKRKIQNHSGIVFAALVLLLCAASPVFSQAPQLKELQNRVDEFSEKLALTLPFNSTIGLNWSDAYIGQLLGVPPHFGAGLSLGFTTTDFGSFNELAGMFGFSLPLNFGGYPIPGYTVEGRIGGVILPFDVGLKFGYLPIKPEDWELDYFLIGGDFRYAILKGSVTVPTVSVGVGYNYLSGGLAKDIGQPLSFGYTDLSSNAQTLTLSAPKVGLLWETSTLDFKAQISKSFLIVTPYLGIGLSHAWSKAGYKIESTIHSSGDLAVAKEAVKQYGIADLSDTGFSSIMSITGWSFRAFGGVSCNLPFFKIDLTGLFNFIDARYGFTVGARFQI
ncbi:MAG: hypothetical protein LBD18_06920 [Treponema sp.]|nr:hypothetical protein [Treponema sp.]